MSLEHIHMLKVVISHQTYSWSFEIWESLLFYFFMALFYLLTFVMLVYVSKLLNYPVFSRVRVTRSSVLYVCFVDRCLSFFTFSFGHYFVCPSSIYGFWLPPFDIFKLFLHYYRNIKIWFHLQLTDFIYLSHWILSHVFHTVIRRTETAVLLKLSLVFIITGKWLASKHHP